MKQSEKIKKLRKQRGFTQKELGERAGIGESTIRKYELGQRNPKFETLKKIADSLGVSATSLLDDNEDTFEESLFREIHFSTLGLIDEVNYKTAPAGYTVKEIIQEGYLWIECPDNSTFEVSKDEITTLNDEIDSFIRFKIEELKKNHTNDLKKKN